MMIICLSNKICIKYNSPEVFSPYFFLIDVSPEVFDLKIGFNRRALRFLADVSEIYQSIGVQLADANEKT